MIHWHVVKCHEVAGRRPHDIVARTKVRGKELTCSTALFIFPRFFSIHLTVYFFFSKLKDQINGQNPWEGQRAETSKCGPSHNLFINFGSLSLAKHLRNSLTIIKE